MTKEELEKEAEEKYSEVDREFIDCQDEGEIFNIGYVLGAEPREKRIAELEKRCANYEMTISKMEKGNCDICKETEKDKKIEELEAQIEKMKCCYNCKHSRTEYEHCKTPKSEKWEIKEK